MAPDRRFYVGASVNIRKRVLEHNSGQAAGQVLASAIRKFELKKFKVSVLETVPLDYDDWIQIWLYERETFWIEALKPPLNMFVVRGGKWVALKLADFEEPAGGW